MSWGCWLCGLTSKRTFTFILDKVRCNIAWSWSRVNAQIFSVVETVMGGVMKGQTRYRLSLLLRAIVCPCRQLFLLWTRILLTNPSEALFFWLFSKLDSLNPTLRVVFLFLFLTDVDGVWILGVIDLSLLLLNSCEFSQCWHSDDIFGSLFTIVLEIFVSGDRGPFPSRWKKNSHARKHAFCDATLLNVFLWNRTPSFQKFVYCK